MHRCIVKSSYTIPGKVKGMVVVRGGRSQRMNSGENMSYFYPVLRENYGTFFVKSRITGIFPFYGTSNDYDSYSSKFANKNPAKHQYFIS